MPAKLIPSLAQLVQTSNLDQDKLCVELEADRLNRRVRIADKHSIAVSDGTKAVSWKVDSLLSLCRGERPAPPDITHYPPEYVPCFYFVEAHFLTLCEAMGDRTDQEVEEIYAALRRRPGGRSLGVSHDFIWQVVALLLGRYELSESELGGILDALLRSARAWSLRPVSRNYAAYLRDNLR